MKNTDSSIDVQAMEKRTLLENYSLLPPALQAQVQKRAATGILMALITTLMVCIFSDWMYAFGFVISLAFIYLGLDIIWKFADEKMLVARMVVCKAQRSLKNRLTLHVILRSAEIEDISTQQVDTFRYDITTSKKDRDIITAGTVLNIYFSETAPHAILAYDILGELHN